MFKPENFVIDKVQKVTGYFTSCPNCGYDVGLAIMLEHCPECGTDLTIKYTKIIEE